MPKGLWLRDGSRAVPADERSLEFLQSVKDGTLFIADTCMSRNPKQLRLWWALCTLVAEHFEVLPETISDDVKIAVGHSEVVKQRDGTHKVKPKSIAEESMPQELFNNLLTAAINKMSEWMGTAPDDLRRRFNEVCADKRYEGVRR
jgi:hypothetical protein